MRVEMTRQRTLQQAGAELLLRVKEVYDLPDPVATSLIATAAAVSAEDEHQVDAPALDVASVRPPERKPIFPPETKGRGRG